MQVPSLLVVGAGVDIGALLLLVETEVDIGPVGVLAEMGRRGAGELDDRALARLEARADVAKDLPFELRLRALDPAPIPARGVVERRASREDDDVGRVVARDDVVLRRDGVVQMEAAEPVAERVKGGVDLAERISVTELVRTGLFLEGAAQVGEVMDIFRSEAL
jgi:hypothetical protein